MLSAGAAVLLAYLPSRHVAQLRRRQALERVVAGSDPALRHALEFARKGLPIEEALVEKAMARLTATATTAGVLLPAPPQDAGAVEPWLSAIAAAVGPLIDTPVLEVAWSAGEAARTIQIEAMLLAQIAYLRCAAPEHGELRASAAAHIQALEAATRAFGGLLARSGLPMVVRLVDSLAKLIALVDDLAPTTVDGYRELNELVRSLATRFDTVARAFDVPPPSRAAAPASEREQALLAAIVADPYDDDARLELARLAGQRGDPRAELITVQFAERAATSRERPGDAVPHMTRARELAISHPEWTAPLLELGAREVKLWRGFPDEITVDAGTLLARGPELYAQAPLTKLHVRAASGRVREVVSSPLLAQIEALDLANQGVTDDDVIALAGSPHSARLRHLELSGNRITERGVEAIARSPHLGGLISVVLAGNPADPVDTLEYHDETRRHYVPTPSGQALEARYGRLRWLHPEPPV